MSKFLAFVLLRAQVEARFLQEHIPVSSVTVLGNFGNSGEAETLGGAVPGVLLAAANPCDKLTLADKIVSTLGNNPEVIKGAAAVVAAEQNFNPFNVDIPSICGNATLPATAELRGIVPLVDPAVTGADTENANSAKSLTTPFDATGLSVAEVMAAQGFRNFTTVDASKSNASSSKKVAAADSSSKTSSRSSGCVAGTAAIVNAAAAAKSTGSSASSSSSSTAAASNSTTTTGSTTSLGGADFGLCTPTMDFQFGRAGRKATEGTFLPTDALVAKGQQDALNPNIITNRICDQLTNVCGANQAAKDACLSAKAVLAGLSTKDQTTADAFNQALGF